MELAEYLGRIWRRKWIVLGVTVLAVAINVAVMLFLPRHYTATSVLEVGGIDSYLSNPGTSRIDTGRQSLPSAIQSDTQSYLTLLNTAAVDDAAEQRAKRTLALGSDSNTTTRTDDGGTISSAAASNDGSLDYTYSSRAEAGKGSGTDIIYIDVTGDDPKTIKAAADALGMVLVEQSRNLSGNVADGFVDGIQKDQIDPLNNKLAAIRDESEKLKATTGGDITARNARIADLTDQAQSLEDTRKQYTDIIARVRVNEAMNLNNLVLVSPAATPSAKTMPPIARSSAIAAVVGFLIGVMIVLAIDRPKSSEPAIF